ncbi:membrane progestin receptor alpha-B-like [Pecten maximus]|uniref:membrane progestin receptor alpha-B-like n=1 Tax=Pecten maximus TaxID=6579 RepID=UPI001458853C|nr:membrane progestin receptor alpha-B-like [Pecten maximus]XP_033756048.1 membrane progestin receptor alpha-B-like [Pecten maximus]
MKFPDSPPTLTLAERMPSEICKKHILTGYRRPHQPWSYYVISVFHANNQTLNVWTHVIGFLFIAYRAYDISLTFDMLHDPTFRPLGAGLLCILTLLAVSSFAHIFGDKSEVAHYACFCMDYDAIALHSLGCTLISHSYFIKEKTLAYFLAKWSRPGCIYLAMQFSVLLSFLKIRFGRANKPSKILQGFAAYASYLWFVLPLIHRHFRQSHSNHDNNLGLHIHHVMLFHLNMLVYIAHLPERWFPKTFDIIGHSHQLHHVTLVLTVNSFLNVTLEELKSSSSIVKFMGRSLGTVENSYGVVMFMIYIDCFVIAVSILYAIMKDSQNSGTREEASSVKSSRTDLCDKKHLSDEGIWVENLVSDETTFQPSSNNPYAYPSSEEEYVIDKSQ